MSSENRVAVFIDTENVAQWVKLGGLETLLEELSSIGVVVVRKAYARWTSTNMAAHQATLNRHGFELIHTYHPVSGKNSADIQIAVDVMEYAWRDDLACIALATGDSDFSPLFRRLREMGKQVIGVGPRSALSESVKSSCSRFFYTQVDAVLSPSNDPASHASDFDDAADLLETALKKFDGPANCSALKTRMLSIDSAFDEKSLGFKNFNTFARAVDGIELMQDGLSWFVAFQENDTASETTSMKPTVAQPKSPANDPSEVYRRLLRKKNWRTIPKPVLTHCFAKMQNLDPVPRPDLLEATISRCGGRITTTDVKKAMQIIFKSKLVSILGRNEDGETLWHIPAVSEDAMIRCVDLAMVVRLASALDELGKPIEPTRIAPLCLAKRTNNDIDALIKEARRLIGDHSSNDQSH